MGRLRDLFTLCLDAPYIHIDGASVCALHRAEGLFLLFQDSEGGIDWKRNLDFFSEPYREMSPKWRVHGGFLEAWRKVMPLVREHLAVGDVGQVIVAGYSHGGALATLCHEYIYFHYEKMRDTLQTVTYGAPRVLSAGLDTSVASRWARLLAVKNTGDIVTNLPPAAFGFMHVGRELSIGQRGKYGPLTAHKAESYLRELTLSGF